jgi:hypothetical protein
MKFFNTLLICLVLLITCNGCVTAGIITLGSVLGALGTAASTGSDVYKLGKLDSAFNCGGDTVFHAALLAANDLGLQVRRTEESTKDRGIWDIVMFDDLGQQTGVHIEGRTRQFCRCRVDIGIFGNEPTARLFQDHIRKHLPPGASASENGAKT